MNPGVSGARGLGYLADRTRGCENVLIRLFRHLGQGIEAVDTEDKLKE